MPRRGRKNNATELFTSTPEFDEWLGKFKIENPKLTLGLSNFTFPHKANHRLGITQKIRIELGFEF